MRHLSSSYHKLVMFLMSEEATSQDAPLGGGEYGRTEPFFCNCRLSAPGIYVDLFISVVVNCIHCHQSSNFYHHHANAYT